MIIGLKKFQSNSKYDVPIILCDSSTLQLLIPDFDSNESLESRVLELYPDYRFDPTKGAEYVFASDASAIVEHTQRVIYLQDGDVAHVKDGHLYIRRSEYKSQIEPVLLEEANILQMKLQEIMKGSFDTFMEKEIFEQPESLVNTMRGRVNFKDKTIKLGGLQHHLRHIARCRRIVFIACGTSYYSCIAIRQLMEELTEIPIMIELASDLLDREMPVFRDDVCVFVSQSGETADTLNALRYCKNFGAILMGVTNVVGSTISRETECGVHLNAGPEIGVASTKAYSSQIVALILFACMLGEDKVTKTHKIVEIIDALRQLPSVIKECLKLSPKIEEIARKYVNSKSCLVIGRGNHSATCLEGALKVKELSYIHSEGIQSGELKHGPLALVDENMLILIVVTDCKVFAKTVSALQQIMARKALPIIITDCKSKIEGIDGLDALEIPHTIDCLQVIPAIIPLQLLSLHLAKLRGFDVDCPRNLAKSITVE
ncbi:Glutamine--fructose-6-phosphate aminotransferase [isomerizing] 2 [Thelohanellus kitauei]|uniref:Glutamine--fructose-6-phosphate aminotransferase [isomerizing] 2 n=1 Tax=Thelohanellus kitauei TaxID=669202 RepID=A0A0C2NLF5_THEKT|nr:Glutamine--fructose-6-phosphate aminotransferase [isomerizing] 2 [Thelohanellus kitauei]